jgi:hypothetical protein
MWRERVAHFYSKYMAERDDPRATSVVAGASHVVMISHADALAKVIEAAANAP